MESPPQKTHLSARATQTLQLLMNEGEEQTRFFLFRRRPAHSVPREWTRPSDDDYIKLLMAEGFITKALLGTAISDELATDVRELEQHLLPHFWRVNQLARYYQNRYYQYQWTFIIAAFATTALAAVNIYLHTQTHTDIGTLSGILGLLTAIVSGIAASVSFLDANQAPQKRWYKARAQAEGLRSLYFLFLARQRPFDTDSGRERVHRMRQKVIDVLRSAGGETRVRTVSATPAKPQPKPATSSSASPSASPTVPPTVPPTASPAQPDQPDPSGR